MINNYLIAGLNICIDSDNDDALNSNLFPYITSKPQSDVYIKIVKTKIPVQIPENAELVKVGPIKYFSDSDGYDTVYFHDINIHKTVAEIKYSPDYKDVRIVSYDFTQDYDLDGKLVIFNLFGHAFSYLIQMYSGFAFHSSAISYKNRGILFSAESGTGKSTHTALWLELFPDTVVVNDDTPVIRLTDGCVKLFGTPWAGSTGLNTNLTVPLDAIVFISRASDNRIVRLQPSDAVKPFYEAVTSPLNPRMLSVSLTAMDSILKKVPAYALACNMNSDAAVTARDFIFGKGD